MAVLEYLGHAGITVEHGGKLLLCHGIDVDDMAVLKPDTRGYGLQSVMMDVRLREDLTFVIGGHTHVRMVRKLGLFTFLNPGTLRREQEPGFMIADFARGVVEHWDVTRGGDVTLADAIELRSLP